MEPNEKNSGWAAPQTAAIEIPIEVQSVRQVISSGSDNLPLQGEQQAYCHPSTDNTNSIAPAPAQPDTLACMYAAKRWLVWSANKKPFYPNGVARNGALDTEADMYSLGTFGEACGAVANSDERFVGVGFALGPDGGGRYWQGIDIDGVELDQIERFANELPGYIELSPSGVGIHAVGYGRRFNALGSNGTGFEAYCEGRYFTFTGQALRNNLITCLADYVEQRIAPAHGVTRSVSQSEGTVWIDEKTTTELRSALLHMRSDDRALWIKIGFALHELGDVGRGLWLAWSATSDKFDPKDAAKTWGGFKPTNTGYQAVFKEAQRQGWLNPGSNAAQLSPATNVVPSPASPSIITLEFAMSSDTATIRLEYLVDPYLPQKCVVGFYGRGSTSKSSFLASIAAHVSAFACTLWVSVEEPVDWIKVRHIGSGGAEKTLAVVKAVESKRDQQGRVTASSFNVYEHLDIAIEEAKAAFVKELKPLRLVVLDTVVGLTSWAKGESANDDGGVKRLLAYLQAQAEKHDLTIAIIGHANKSKHDHFADAVMGASAWTNSPRLSFIHASDRREDYSYVMRVAKTNLVTFGVTYKTEPVHTLYEREDGPDSVLCRVEPGPIVWGDIASMEMFEDATRKTDEDNQGFSPRAQTQVDIVIDALVGMVMAITPDQHVTREDVDLKLGFKLDRARWKKVDEQLNLNPFVTIARGAQYRVLYKRKT